MTCLTCAHATLRDPNSQERDRALRSMARLGWANCELTNRCAGFRPFGHRCERFQAADDKVAGARQAWVAKNASPSTGPA